MVADKFLTILFDAAHPKITDSQTALQAGLWANFPTFSPLALWNAWCAKIIYGKQIVLSVLLPKIAKR